MNSKRIKILVEGAMMIALATVLSYIKIFELPQGGSITIEMIPLVVMAYRHGIKWGTFTAFVHGVLQMIIGFSNVLYCATLIAQIGCILLDYLLAFTALGLAPIGLKLTKNKTLGYAIGSIIAGLLRFLCSFLSGWLLWGSYAPEGQGAVIYSLTYNGSYMIPNIILMTIVVVLLCKTAPKLMDEQ